MLKYWHLNLYEQENEHSRLIWAWKMLSFFIFLYLWNKFYNLRANPKQKIWTWDMGTNNDPNVPKYWDT